MSEHDAILFANAAFYAAFSTCDVATMENVWAKDRAVSCIHPGRPALTGRAAVMRSWSAILGNPEPLRISSHAETVQVLGDVALVTCVEKVRFGSGTQFLAATNVFVRAGSVWLMVHHQAGGAQIDPASLKTEEKGPPN
jgi:ketosteroid isomerase-like protein